MALIYRYPGSTPFTREYERVFFGRADEVAGLAKLITTEPVTVLYGKSGLGKSSLLNAGVLLALEREANYVVIPIRFNTYSKGATLHAVDVMEEQISKLAPAEDFYSEIESSNISLWQRFKSVQLANQNAACFLLVFDQFEELFTHPDETVEEFAESLSEVLHQKMPKPFERRLRLKDKERTDFLSEQQWKLLTLPVPIRVVVSIRSDRLSLLDRLSSNLPNILRNCYELKPLTESQAQASLCGPAQCEGEFRSKPFTYEQDAIDKILSYLGGSGKKSIESFQLQILCNYIEEEIVIRQDRQIVRAGDLVDPDKIYESYYEYSVGKLEKTKQQLARVFIEKGLVFEEERVRVSVYEGQALRNYGVDAALLRDLVNTHIIRAEPYHAGGSVYELSHDTLVAPVLKAKVRREQKEAIDTRKKKASRRAWIYGVVVLMAVVFAEVASEDVRAYAVAALVFLVLIAGGLSFIYVVDEFVTGESWLARRARRKTERARTAVA